MPEESDPGRWSGLRGPLSSGSELSLSVVSSSGGPLGQCLGGFSGEKVTSKTIPALTRTCSCVPIRVRCPPWICTRWPGGASVCRTLCRAGRANVSPSTLSQTRPLSTGLLSIKMALCSGAHRAGGTGRFRMDSVATITAWQRFPWKRQSVMRGCAACRRVRSARKPSTCRRLRLRSSRCKCAMVWRSGTPSFNTRKWTPGIPV